jgi:hypothetical protein
MRKRPATGAFLAIFLLTLFCASTAYADKVVIRFSDGTVRTIDLDKDYDSVEVIREAPPPPAVPLQSYIGIDFDAVNRGQTVEITYSATAKLTGTAWLGIIPSDVPHGDGYENDRYDVLFVYLKGRATGAVKVTIPTNIQQGEYEIRIFDSDDNGHEVASSAPFYVY